MWGRNQVDIKLKFCAKNSPLRQYRKEMHKHKSDEPHLQKPTGTFLKVNAHWQLESLTQKV